MATATALSSNLAFFDAGPSSATELAVTLAMAVQEGSKVLELGQGSLLLILMSETDI